MGLVFRALGALGLSLLAALTGCDPPVMRALYGPPPVEHDPTVEIADFSYEPAGSVRVGDTLTFTVETNKPFAGSQGWIEADIGSPASPVAGYSTSTLWVPMSDSGISGDQTAGDGVWTGRLEWLAEYGPQQDLPVAAHLHWADGYNTEPVFAAPLTVLPAEDAAP